MTVNRVLLTLAGCVAACLATPGEAFAREPAPAGTVAPVAAAWSTPTADAAQAMALAWLDERGATPQQRAVALALWPAAAGPVPGGELLDRLVATLAVAEPRAAHLLAWCSRPLAGAQLPDTAWLFDEAVSPLERNNLRLFVGRWLIAYDLYEEAAAHLRGVTSTDVVDPAGLLFYQAVAAHRLLDRDAGLAALRQLKRGQDVPARFTSVAALMQQDLEQLKDDSLDHIARRMADIERRLDLGRAGPKTREVEDGVIASLDKLIEEIEKQQQQQSGAAGAAAAPSMPAQDSRPMEGKGPGEITPRAIGSQSGWGDLPPKAREEALQQIGQQFPAHYRDAIEQYFRRSAQGADGGNDDQQP
ncbi:MAG: hypothetical protein K1X74_08940 [Pirellulales bacterium]|nr:hypothetical protein [Pirellulales bacterium]